MSVCCVRERREWEREDDKEDKDMKVKSLEL